MRKLQVANPDERITRWAFAQQPGSWRAKLVLLALAARADSCGRSAATQAQIQRETGMCRITVRNCLVALRNSRIIRLEETGRRSPAYRLILPWLTPAEFRCGVAP